MTRFYGKPTLFIRHRPDVAQYVCEPQRAMHIPLWYNSTDKAAGTDGSIDTALSVKTGSRITKHHLALEVIPETVDPQKVYMATIKLSWHDVFNPYVMGEEIGFDTYQGTVTETNKTAYIRVWPGDDITDQIVEYQTGQIDMQERDLAADKYVWHTLKTLRKFTVFNQMPLISERNMRVPAKVKRINPFTYYGLLVFNDAPRGGTPADTQVTFNVKNDFDEWQVAT